MPRPKDFEDYLQEIFSKENPSYLDDDIPDYFDRWLEGLQADEWIEYGQKYGEQCKKEAI